MNIFQKILGEQKDSPEGLFSDIQKPTNIFQRIIRERTEESGIIDLERMGINPNLKWEAPPERTRTQRFLDTAKERIWEPIAETFTKRTADERDYLNFTQKLRKDALDNIEHRIKRIETLDSLLVDYEEREDWENYNRLVPDYNELANQIGRDIKILSGPTPGLMLRGPFSDEHEIMPYAGTSLVGVSTIPGRIAARVLEGITGWGAGIGKSAVDIKRDIFGQEKTEWYIPGVGEIKSYQDSHGDYVKWAKEEQNMTDWDAKAFAVCVTTVNIAWDAAIITSLSSRAIYATLSKMGYDPRVARIMKTYGLSTTMTQKQMDAKVKMLWNDAIKKGNLSAAQLIKSDMLYLASKNKAIAYPVRDIMKASTREQIGKGTFKTNYYYMPGDTTIYVSPSPAPHQTFIPGPRFQQFINLVDYFNVPLNKIKLKYLQNNYVMGDFLPSGLQTYYAGLDPGEAARIVGSHIMNKAATANNLAAFKQSLTKTEMSKVVQSGIAAGVLFESVKGAKDLVISPQLEGLADKARGNRTVQEFSKSLTDAEKDIIDPTLLKRQDVINNFYAAATKGVDPISVPQVTPPTVNEVLDIKPAPFITKRETTLLKERFRNIARGAREATITTRAEIQKAQAELVDILKTAKVPKEELGWFTGTFQQIGSRDALLKKIPEIQARIDRLENARLSRSYDAQITKELSKTEPRRVGLRRPSKYDIETDRFFTEIRGYNRMTKEQAAARIQELGEPLTELDRSRIRFLEYRAMGAEASPELKRVALQDMQRLRINAEAAKDFQEFKRLSDRQNLIDEALKGTATRIGGTEGQNVIQRVFTERIYGTIRNGYIRGVANLYSTMNGVFGKEFADKFDPTLAVNRSDTAIYFSNKGVKEEIGKALGTRNGYQFINKLHDNSKEEIAATLLTEEKIKLSKNQLLDIYNSVKNPLGKERYHNFFGKAETNRLMGLLSPKEKRAADIAQEAVQGYRPVYNEYHIYKFNRDMGIQENYWPLTSERELEIFDEIKMQSNLPSALKQRSDYAKIKPAPKDFYQKMVKHIETGEHVRHVSRRHDELINIFTDGRVKRAIEAKFGDGVYKDLMFHTENLSLSKYTERLDAISGLFNTMVDNWVKAKVAIPLSIMPKQLGSFTNYASVMPSGVFITDFTYGLAHPRKVFDYMWSNNPFLAARFARGYSEAIKDALKGSQLLKSGLKERWDRGLTMAVRAGDIGAIVYGGYPFFKYHYETAIQQGLSHPEALSKARDVFEVETLRAQQAGIDVSLSRVQQKRDPFFRAFFRFKNTISQYMRKMGDATLQYAHGEIPLPQYTKLMTNYGLIQTIIYMTIGTMVGMGIYNLGRKMRGKDTEWDMQKLFDNILQHMVTMPFQVIPIVDMMATYAYRRMRGQPTWKPLQMPIVDDYIEGIGKMTQDEPTFQDFLEGAGVPMAETLTGFPAETILRYYRTLTEDVDDTTSLPAPREKSKGEMDDFDRLLMEELGGNEQTEDPFQQLFSPPKEKKEIDTFEQLFQ